MIIKLFKGVYFCFSYITYVLWKAGCSSVVRYRLVMWLVVSMIPLGGPIELFIPASPPLIVYVLSCQLVLAAN